jgi:inosose dehydratase
MTVPDADRRSFLRSAAVAAGAVLGVGSSMHDARTAEKSPLHIACNQYPWTTFFKRANRDFNKDALSSVLAETSWTGIQGYEPLAVAVNDIEQLAPILRANRLQMRSLYVNSTLHDKAQTEANIAQVLEIAKRARHLLGTRIVVTNPSPIRWGGPENKTDEQLVVQAAALDQLGAKLASLGLLLAYHNHDIELRLAAREFHHMMMGTDPGLVTLCLDAHWIYRGSGDSLVALFDVVKLYGSRISELHLRQSKDGVWTESFCDGDIDYRALAKQILEFGLKPHLVLEQAVEEKSPNTMEAAEAHRKSREYAAEVFASFAT